jgi:general secretion pathway protein L
MLSTSSAVLAQFKELKIKSLRYYDGQINLELQLASLQDLDKLKKQLKEEKGYQVDIQNASAEKEFVTARLQISGVAL